LRITLKAPAEIAARGPGPNLEVEIAASVAPPPVVIGFARNQSDPKRISLSTCCLSGRSCLPIDGPRRGRQLTKFRATGTRRAALRSFAISPPARPADW
jgi:hypothetical protein